MQELGRRMEGHMSRTSLGLAVAAALAVGGLAVSAAPATATPLLDPGVAQHSDADRAKPEQVRWVCNRWGRCWWRPNYYGPRRFYGGGWGPRPWGYRPWGYRHHRGWRHHRRW